MPRYLDQISLGRALRYHANPLLQVYASNDELLAHSLRRFERDDPPQYESPTSSEYDESVSSPPREPQEILERPFDDYERRLIAFVVGSETSPEQRYLAESKLEEKRIMKECKGRIFIKPKGIRRQGIVVRHNMKKRWEKLGIWNPAWGFAGRNLEPCDDASGWRWKWAQNNGENSVSDRRDKEFDLVMDILLQRKDLRRGEHVPIEPRSCLGQDATASEAESFLTSRPWFVFQLELFEERTRYARLDLKQQEQLRHHSHWAQVVEWWKERGDWRDEFDEEGVNSWKWRHESPSPEPEDLTPINNIGEFDSLDATVMDFTPSEIDDLETNELPYEEQPKTFWVVGKGKERAPAFPGQMPFGFHIDHYSPRMPIARSAPACGSGKGASKKADDTTLPSAHMPVQNRTDIAQDHGQHSPARRRSARIAAGTKRAAESMPPEATPNKKLKGGKAPHAKQLTMSGSQQRKKRPAPAEPSPQMETGALPKRKRKRTEMEAPEPAPADTVTEEQPRRGRVRPRNEALKRGPVQENVTKRGRGRPRKEKAATRRAAVVKNR